MKKYTMKKMLKARSICWVVFSIQGIQVSTPSLQGEYRIQNTDKDREDGLPGGIYEVYHQGGEGQDEHQANLLVILGYIKHFQISFN
jgi:hypothetical protein